MTATAWGAAAIAGFALVNLCGVRWGGRTQIFLTIVKIVGILALIVGSLTLAAPGHAAPGPRRPRTWKPACWGSLRLIGLGVAAVLFTYDGWVDVTHVAGEVREPARHLPLALGLGVGGLTLLYLVVNYAYLRVVPLEAMRTTHTTAVATTVAVAAFGPTGGEVLNALIIVSILGALGGLILTLPRLYYAAAEQYRDATDAPARELLLPRAGLGSRAQRGPRRLRALHGRALHRGPLLLRHVPADRDLLRRARARREHPARGFGLPLAAPAGQPDGLPRARLSARARGVRARPRAFPGGRDRL